MHRVIVIDQHGNESERLYEGSSHRRASLTYCRAALRRKGVHLRWIDGDELPGLPPNVVAQRFGAPCEEPCCVPLASAWPEQDAVPNSGQPDERERKRDA